MSRAFLHAALAVKLVTLSASAVGANLVLNGSFEDNTSVYTRYNMSYDDFSLYMSNATPSKYPIYGYEEIDILKNGSYFGANPDGNTSVGLVTNHDRIGLLLSSSLTIGSTYNVSLMYRSSSYQLGTDLMGVYLGTSATDFDTAIDTFGASLVRDQWLSKTFSFVATANSTYLNIGGISTGNLNDRNWYAIDAVTLTLDEGGGGGGASVPEPSTYGLVLGSLALAAVAVRRRRSK